MSGAKQKFVGHVDRLFGALTTKFPQCQEQAVKFVGVCKKHANASMDVWYHTFKKHFEECEQQDVAVIRKLDRMPSLKEMHLAELYEQLDTDDEEVIWLCLVGCNEASEQHWQKSNPLTRRLRRVRAHIHKPRESTRGDKGGDEPATSEDT